MEKLEQAIGIWQAVCKKWDVAEQRQLALGAEFWYPAGPELAVKNIQADEIMEVLHIARSNADAVPVEELVEQIIAGQHRLQQ